MLVNFHGREHILYRLAATYEEKVGGFAVPDL